MLRNSVSTRYEKEGGDPKQRGRPNDKDASYDEDDDNNDNDQDDDDIGPDEGIEVYENDYETYDLKLLPKQVRAIANKIEYCKEIPCVMSSPSSYDDSPTSGSGNGRMLWSKLTSVMGLQPYPKNENQLSSSSSSSCVILSFLVKDPMAEQEADILARIQVYCNTGTVGVCRVQKDQVREMFFRNCSLNRIEKILKHPPPLRNIRQVETFLKQQVSMNSITTTTTSTSSATTTTDHDYAVQHEDDDNSTWVTQWIDEKEEQDLKMNLELLDVAIAILQGEKDDLVSHAKYLEQYKLEQQENEQDNDYNVNDDDEEEEDYHERSGVTGSRRTRRLPKEIPPTDFLYLLPMKMMSTLDTWLKESIDRKDILTCATTNGPNTILVYASGKYYTTPNIPGALRDTIETKMSSSSGSDDGSKKKTKQKIRYVSLGTNQRYFVSFVDGECNWFGPKTLDTLLKDYRHTSKQITSLAFGQQNSTYFIVYDDGSWTCSSGQGIPSGLIAKLNERKNLQDLACVTLGPEGEWFLKARNGRMWWGGVSNELDDMYNSAITRKKKLKFVDFGEDQSYFMSFIEDK